MLAHEQLIQSGIQNQQSATWRESPRHHQRRTSYDEHAAFFSGTFYGLTSMVERADCTVKRKQKDERKKPDTDKAKCT